MPISRNEFLKQRAFSAAGILLTPIFSSGARLQSKTIRIGIIGCGSGSNVYLPHRKQSPYAEVRYPIRSGSASGTKFNVKDLYPNIEAMVILIRNQKSEIINQ